VRNAAGLNGRARPAGGIAGNVGAAYAFVMSENFSGQLTAVATAAFAVLAAAVAGESSSRVAWGAVDWCWRQVCGGSSSRDVGGDQGDGAAAG
jgi:hypothetical protein